MKKLLQAAVVAFLLALGLSAEAHAQDLNTLLVKFLTNLLAGQIVVPNAGTVTLTGSSQPMFSGAQTWNNAATTFIGFKLAITDTASASGALAIQALCGSATTTNCFTVSKAGNVSFAGSLTAGGGSTGDFFASSTGVFGATSRGVFNSAADGEMDLLNNAGSSNAGLRYTRIVEANTGAKSPTVLECGETYTNTGDGDGSSVALPNDPTAGCFFTIIATAAQTITITVASGESLRAGTSTCGTSITFNTVASNVTILATSAGNGAIWAVIASVGTVTCNA